MTHKHKGLSYTLKNWERKGKASKALRMQVLRCVLAVGFALSPWLGGEAFAADAGIVRVNDIPSGLTKEYLPAGATVAHIYAEQVSGTVGLNRFESFKVDSNQIANIHFQAYNDSTVLNTIVNTVKSKIEINGYVNAIRNNKIGGNLYFISPNGMVVGSGGVINAGSLTVVAPTQDDFNTIINAEAAAARVNQSNSNTWAWGHLDDGISIDVSGQINTATGIDLRAAIINIYKGSTNSSLRTGVMFNETVNLDNVTQQAGNIITGGRLTVLTDSEGHIVFDDDDNVTVYDPSNEAGASDDALVKGTGVIKLRAEEYDGGYFGTLTIDGGNLDALGNVFIEAGTRFSIKNNANIQSEEEIKIDLENSSGQNFFGDLDFNSGKIEADGLVKIIVGKTITIGNDAEIISGISKSEPDDKAKLVTQTGTITNHGEINANTTLDIQAGVKGGSDNASIINSGTIQSTGGGMSLTADRLLTNTGKIQATSEIKFTVGGTLTNEGKIESTSSNVQAHIGRNFKNLAVPSDPSDISTLTGGIIQAGGNVQVDYELKTTGIGVATEAGTIDGIYNSGLIQANGDEDPTSTGGVVNVGSGRGNIWLTSSYNITNKGTMEANRQITLNARDFLHNYGLIQGVTYLDIKSIMGYVYNHTSGKIIATGGNIDLSSGQANLQINDDDTGEKKELYRKFTPIIIEGIVEATSDDDKNNQTKEGNINITAHLGDIYINGGTIETKPELGTNDEVKAVAGNVTLKAAENITIGFQTVKAWADDPTTDAKNDTEREYYKPLKDTSGNLVSGEAVKIYGSNIILTLGSEENTVSMSEASSKIRLTSDSEAKGISWSSKIELNASNAVAINTDSMNIVGGTINAGTLAASKDLNITGGKINTNNITAGNELNVTGGEVSSNGSLELNGGGNVNIGSGASVEADNDIALTSSGADVTASSITLGGSLQLQGNNITVSDVQRSGNPTEPLKVEANGADGTDSAINSLNLTITGDASFESLNVTNAEIETTNGTLEVGQLKVEGKAQLTSTVGETSNSIDIYGKNATPEAGSGDVIRDTGDYVTIKIDDKGYEATVVGNNDNEGAVRLSTKLVDYDPYETYAEHYGDVADLFGRSDLIEASERSEGETAKDDGKAVLKQDEKGLRIEAKEA